MDEVWFSVLYRLFAQTLVKNREIWGNMTIVLKEMGRWQLSGRHNPDGPVEEFNIGPEPVRMGDLPPRT